VKEPLRHAVYNASSIKDGDTTADDR